MTPATTSDFNKSHKMWCCVGPRGATTAFSEVFLCEGGHSLMGHSLVEAP